MTEPVEYKMVIMGPGGVGKSALTIRLISGYFAEEYDPTIEDSYRKTCEVDGVVATLDILDTAGQEEFAALRDQWIRESWGFVLVYSITSQGTFDELEGFIKLITRIKEDELDKIAVVLAGNKCDLEKHREISKEAGQKLADSWKNTLGIKKTLFYETSAKEKINSEEVYFGVVQLLREIEKEENGDNGNNNGSGNGNNKCCQIL